MRQEMAHGARRFARLCELGPVASDGRVEIEQAGLDEPKRANGGDSLADGVEVDDRVSLPRSGPRGVGVACPQVDDSVPVDVDGKGSAHLGTGGENFGEGVADPLECRLAMPGYDRITIVHRSSTTGGLGSRGQRGSLVFTDSPGMSSVNIVPHCLHEHGIRVMSVPQNIRSGPKAS